MISVSTIMRTFRGVTVLRIETVAELNARVNTSATHITIVFSTRFVTASVLQIPRTCLKMGLSRHIPCMTIFRTSVPRGARAH